MCLKLALACTLSIAFALASLNPTLSSVPQATAEGPVSIQIRAQPTEITLGDHIRLLLTLRSPKDTNVEIPNIGQALSPFEVLKVRPTPTQRSNSPNNVIEVEYTITIFTVGQISIPPVAVYYTDEKGVRQVAASEEIPVVVRSTMGSGDPAGLRDIKPPVEIPRGPLPLREWGLTGIAAMAVLGSIGLLVRLIATRRPREIIPEIGGPPPREWARAELTRIAAMDLPERGEYKRYYALLANCTRRYLAGEYGPWAMGCTTRELNQEMERRGLDRWQTRVVSGLLDECDAVRWAQYMPARERARQALTMAYTILNEEA